MRIVAAIALLALIGCRAEILPSAASFPDATAGDGGPSDALDAMTDAGLRADATPRDASVDAAIDAGARDTGVSDAAGSDAAPGDAFAPDAFAPDAASPDAGTPFDASIAPDAAGLDASPSPDGGNGGGRPDR